MKKKWIWVGVVVIIVAAVAARNISRKASVPKDAAVDEVGVVVAEVAQGDLSQEVIVTGTVKSDLEVNLVPKAAGRVLSVGVEVGTPVRAGQVLVRLDATDYKAALRQAEAGLSGAKARLAQVRSGAGPQDLKQAQAAVNQAQASLEGARRGLAAAKNQYENRTNTQAQINAAQTQLAVSEAAVNSAQTGLASAKARAESANSNLARMEQLFRQDAITRQQLDGARLEADLAQAQVDAALSGLRQAQASFEGSRKGLQSAEDIHSNRTLAQQQVDSAQSQYEIAKAACEAAEARFAQLKAGARTEEIAVASSAVEQAQAGVEQARLQLANTVITSPIDGVVAQRMIQPGEMASPGQPILVLVQANRLTMEAQVAETVIPHLVEGQAAVAEVDALPGLKIPGKIKNLAPAADSRTKGFLVRVLLGNTEGLKAGMLGKLILQTSEEKQVLKIPLAAVVSRGDKDYVFTVRDGKASQVPVKLGLRGDREIEVCSGLKRGDLVVTRGADGLATGTRVVVIEEGSVN